MAEVLLLKLKSAVTVIILTPVEKIFFTTEAFLRLGVRNEFSFEPPVPLCFVLKQNEERLSFLRPGISPEAARANGCKMILGTECALCHINEPLDTYTGMSAFRDVLRLVSESPSEFLVGFGRKRMDLFTFWDQVNTRRPFSKTAIAIRKL